jgi:hypothetical protein
MPATNTATTKTSKITTKRAGKAIGGGELHHVMCGGKVIGTINNTLGLWIAHSDSNSPGNFTTHDDKASALAMFM